MGRAENSLLCDSESELRLSGGREKGRAKIINGNGMAKNIMSALFLFP